MAKSIPLLLNFNVNASKSMSNDSNMIIKLIERKYWLAIEACKLEETFEFYMKPQETIKT